MVEDVLPADEGRLVKSTGDGLLLEFMRVQSAMTAAFAIQRASDIANLGLAADRRMLLRMGAQVGEVITDEHDVYGRGVNLAARLTTLAGPGEIVASAGVRDQLTAILDADVEDLGECFVKHMDEPVRAYRVGPPGPRPVIEPGAGALPELLPSIAVIPFSVRGTEPEHLMLGEMLADEIIAALSRTSELHVISRLSTTVFRGAQVLAAERQRAPERQLRPAWLPTAPSVRASRSMPNWPRRNPAGSSGRRLIKGHVAGIMSGVDPLIDRVVAETSAAVLARELQRAQSLALPTLESYTLLLGAIALMHRLSLQDFERARQMLQALIDRAPRQAVPYAWLAKWHVLRVQAGVDGGPEGRSAPGAGLHAALRSMPILPDRWR